MRPGPRTTVLTTDVRTAMRRPASAWDYAEGLPPELGGRPAAAPRQASAQAVAPVAAPPVQLAMPTPVAPPRPAATPAPAPREAAMAADRIKPLRQPEAQAAVPGKTAAATGVSPVPAASAASQRAEANVAHVLALLDQPAPVDRPRTPAALLARDLRRDPAAVLERVRSSRLLADKRRYRLRSAPAAEPHRDDEGKLKALSVADAPHGVSLDQRHGPGDAALGEAVLADASVSEISLRDRIPHPAFFWEAPIHRP
jgi:hypothetical protein